MRGDDAIRDAVELLSRQGRDGDTRIAHINVQEEALLRAIGGRGTVNPATGLLEFATSGDTDRERSSGVRSGTSADRGGSNAGSKGGGREDKAKGTADPNRGKITDDRTGREKGGGLAPDTKGDTAGGGLGLGSAAGGAIGTALGGPLGGIVGGLLGGLFDDMDLGQPAQRPTGAPSRLGPPGKGDRGGRDDERDPRVQKSIQSQTQSGVQTGDPNAPATDLTPIQDLIDQLLFPGFDKPTPYSMDMSIHHEVLNNAIQRMFRSGQGAQTPIIGGINNVPA